MKRKDEGGRMKDEGAAPKTTVWCFYHRPDLDGQCAGAVVQLWCREKGFAFVPRGVDYGDDTDWTEGAGPHSMAVIVDFTPEGQAAAATLRRMQAAYGGGLLWFDHHKTAIERVGDNLTAGRREEGIAGCELAWTGLFPGLPVPEAVRLLGRYDVFDQSDADRWESRILPFQYGMRLLDTVPLEGAEPTAWGRLLRDDFGFIGEIMSRGGACLEFERRNNARAAWFTAYDCVFEGLPCCAMNARGNSLALAAIARPDHKMRVLWHFAKGRWRVSLFENGHDDIDCGAIAQLHGGGGHRGAAGFSFPGEISPLVYFPPAGEKDEGGRMEDGGAGGGAGPEARGGGR